MGGMPAEMASNFGWIDWLVIAGYLLIVITIGVVVARRRSASDDPFLASRSMPMWAVAISILATSQSAATFVGGPEESYSGDLTYLFSNVASLIAAIIVATLFLPAYYRAGVTSVYELIGQRMGGRAQRTASAMFMLGRVFASGARLYIVAIPFSLIAFGNVNYESLVLAIVIIAFGATAYTMLGGIQAVIWTDVLQAVVYVGSIVIALIVLLGKIPISIGEVFDAIRASDDAAKLTLIDFGSGTVEDLSRPYTVWAVVFGLTVFMVAAYGADQDLTQRMLTCTSARRGSGSVILSNVIGWPVVGLFLLMGLLLYVYYDRPDIMGDLAPAYEPSFAPSVFIEFILHEMPTGLRGLMLAGLFAAAMSSMDSALNAMTTTAVVDFVRPSSGSIDSKREARLARRLTVGWAMALMTFAIICVSWQQSSGQTLIRFALGVMVFAYSGLLGVFATALLTRRGNATSATAALATGFVLVLVLKDPVYGRWAFDWMPERLAFPWMMALATAISAGVCMMGKRGERGAVV